MFLEQILEQKLISKTVVTNFFWLSSSTKTRYKNILFLFFFKYLFWKDCSKLQYLFLVVDAKNNFNLVYLSELRCILKKLIFFYFMTFLHLVECFYENGIKYPHSWLINFFLFFYFFYVFLNFVRTQKEKGKNIVYNSIGVSGYNFTKKQNWDCFCLDVIKSVFFLSRKRLKSGSHGEKTTNFEI